VAAVALLVLVWGSIVFGVPAAARIVAQRMNPAVERQMGAQALSTLDRIALEPSELPTARRQVLTNRFAALVKAAAPDAGAAPADQDQQTAEAEAAAAAAAAAAGQPAAAAAALA
jgi:hypothetical protein